MIKSLKLLAISSHSPFFLSSFDYHLPFSMIITTFFLFSHYQSLRSFLLFSIVTNTNVPQSNSRAIPVNPKFSRPVSIAVPIFPNSNSTLPANYLFLSPLPQLFSFSFSLLSLSSRSLSFLLSVSNSFIFSVYFLLSQFPAKMSDQHAPATSPASAIPTLVIPTYRFVRPLTIVSPFSDPGKIETFLVDLFHTLNEVNCASYLFDITNQERFPYFPIREQDTSTPDLALTSYIINLLSPSLKEVVEAHRTLVKIMKSLISHCAQVAPQTSSIPKLVEELKFDTWDDLSNFITALNRIRRVGERQGMVVNDSYMKDLVFMHLGKFVELKWFCGYHRNSSVSFEDMITALNNQATDKCSLTNPNAIPANNFAFVAQHNQYQQQNHQQFQQQQFQHQQFQQQQFQKQQFQPNDFAFVTTQQQQFQPFCSNCKLRDHPLGASCPRPQNGGMSQFEYWKLHCLTPRPEMAHKYQSWIANGCRPMRSRYSQSSSNLEAMITKIINDVILKTNKTNNSNYPEVYDLISSSKVLSAIPTETNPKQMSELWLFDSGDKNAFMEGTLVTPTKPVVIGIGDGSTVMLKGVGDIKLDIVINNTNKEIVLHNF